MYESIMKANAVKQLMEKVRSCFLDKHTQGLLLREINKRTRRSQPKLLQEVKGLVDRIHDNDTHAIQPVLERCYLQGLYRDHKLIRYFLKAKIDSWPSESIRVILEQQNNTLDYMSNNSKMIPSITFPSPAEREIPSITSILASDLDSSSAKELDPLPINGALYTDRDQEHNTMLTQVLTLYKFLRSNSFLHSRNLGSPIAQIPLTALGDDVSEARKKNVVKKKIAHIRTAFTTLPPLEVADSEILTKVVDEWYEKPPVAGSLGVEVRREYKKFLRKTYTIDKDFNISLNKYAYARPNVATKDTYFESLE